MCVQLALAQVLAMRWSLLISIVLTLGGCSSFGGCCNHTTSAHLYAWDGLGVDPNRPARKITHRDAKAAVSSTQRQPDKELELAALPKYSADWWSLHDTIELQKDAALARAMIICRGCLAAKIDDQTGSIK